MLLWQVFKPKMNPGIQIGKNRKAGRICLVIRHNAMKKNNAKYSANFYV